MLVTLAILSILAGVTIPYAEVAVKRNKEMELKRDLREMRSAIDQFHQDWLTGALPKWSGAASDDGYPKTLSALVTGVESSTPGSRKKYLRRIVENPFGDTSLSPENQWGLRSYSDAPDTQSWGGRDVWDVYCPGDGKALDGTFYHDW